MRCCNQPQLQVVNGRRPNQMNHQHSLGSSTPVHRHSFSSPPSPDLIDMSCSSPIQLEQGTGWTLDHTCTVASVSFRRSLAESNAGRACRQGSKVLAEIHHLCKKPPLLGIGHLLGSGLTKAELCSMKPLGLPRRISIIQSFQQITNGMPPVRSRIHQQQDLVGEIPDQIACL